MKKENLTTIYVDDKVWCIDIFPTDVEKYLIQARKENPNTKVSKKTSFQEIYSETDIENMTDEDKAHYLNNTMANEIKQRLEYLRGEIAELQSLVEHIDPSGTVLLEWAGVPEFTN